MNWQADHNLEQDGKFGPRTARTVVRELRAEGMHRLARLVRTDNFIQVRTVTGPTYNTCAVNDFLWEVTFRTSLRHGFIVQRIDNVFNQTAGPVVPALIPTARLWEAWSVDGAGNVTPLAPAPSGAMSNDDWVRNFPAGSSGNWRITGTLFTVLRLPVAAGFAAGNIADAGILQSTAIRPRGLGLPEGFLPIDRDEGSRTIGGEWDCANPIPASRFHNRR